MTLKDNWKIDQGKTAFVTIDLQPTWLEPGSPRELAQARTMVPKINELADICRRLQIPIIHVRTAVRSDLSDIGLLQEFRPRTDSELEYLEGRRGAEFYKVLDARKGDYTVIKIRYSAFIPGSSSLEPLLRGLGKDSLIVCGLATDVCVGTTVRDAMMLGFRVFLVSDLTATFNEERQRVELEVLGQHFAKVVTSEQVKVELKQLATK